MTTIIGTPLELNISFGQGAFTSTTATDIGTLGDSRGANTSSHPTGSDFQIFDHREDDHYDFHLELPSSITNTTDITNKIQLTLNNGMLAFRNNVFDPTNPQAQADRIFGYIFLYEKYTEGGVDKRKVFPNPTGGNNIHSGSGFDQFAATVVGDAGIQLSKQNFSINYQADDNGLTEPFPLGSADFVSTFDDSDLTPKQIFQLNLKDITGWDGKFNSGSEYYIGFSIRVNSTTYGTEAFAVGYETFDVTTLRSPIGFASAVTKSTTASLSTAFNCDDVRATLQHNDPTRTNSTGYYNPFTSKAHIQKGAGTFDDSSGDVVKHYNLYPYKVRGLTGDGGVNRGTGIPTIAILDQVDISEIDENATITRITVKITIDNQTVATDLFGSNANSAGYSGSQKGGFIGCNIRFDNTNQALTTAQSLNTGVGILTQESAPQEIQSTGEATYTFDFYNSGSALTTQTHTGVNPTDAIQTVNVTPKQIKNLYDGAPNDPLVEQDRICFGIHFIHEGHGMLSSEANDDSGLFRDVTNVEVQIEYTGKTYLTTGYTLWPNTAFAGVNTTGSSDYEGQVGLRTLGNVLASSLINNTDSDIQGYTFNTSYPADAFTTEDTVIATNGATGQTNPPFLVWGDDDSGATNPWIANTKHIRDGANDSFEIAASSDADSYVFNLAYRDGIVGNADLTTSFTTTATPIQFHRLNDNEIDDQSASFTTTAFGGFLLEATAGFSSAFNLQNTGLAGLTRTGFTIDPSAAFNLVAEGDLAVTGVSIQLFSTTVALDPNNVGITTSTPIPLSTAIDLQNTGLAGMIRTGFTLDPVAAFSVADVDSIIIVDPPQANKFTTLTNTRSHTIAQDDRAVTVAQNDRTFVIKQDDRTVDVATQTRTIGADAL